MAERGVLVLGAGGFIGRALVARLAARGERVMDALREGRLSPRTDWLRLLGDARAVVHLATRAHAPPQSDEAWIEEEVATASALAAAGLRAGLERVVFLSSIKVHGEGGASPFRATDPPAPTDPYGRAKRRIEQAIAASGLPFVMLRPPLVYGPGVKANFRALLAIVERGLPLPLGSVANARSLIGLDNLLDLIECVLDDPRALGQTFLMRDERSVSTPELIRLIAAGLERPARLFPCPTGMLRTLARLCGRGEDAERLLASLVVDDAATRARLGWRPRVALEAGIAAACRAYLEERQLSGAGSSESVRPNTR